jgi:hypothetical protein
MSGIVPDVGVMRTRIIALVLQNMALLGPPAKATDIWHTLLVLVLDKAIPLPLYALVLELIWHPVAARRASFRRLIPVELVTAIVCQVHAEVYSR